MASLRKVIKAFDCAGLLTEHVFLASLFQAGTSRKLPWPLFLGKWHNQRSKANNLPTV
jgi:hypothetical protein